MPRPFRSVLRLALLGSALGRAVGLIALYLSALGLSLGCEVQRTAASPLDALHDYVDAVRRGDAPRAYALLSASAKQSLSYPEFQHMLLADPAQAKELLATVDGAARVQDVRAEVVAENGEVLRLTLEDGAWKADLSSIDVYSQATPLAALSAFVRAFDRQRYDILLRLVPARDAKGLTAAQLKAAWEGKQRAEMEQWVQSLRRALPYARTETVGERASIAYGEAEHVELLNEAGVWKIEAL